MDLPKFLRKFSNASVEPKILYGLHFSDGVAQYKDQDLMIFVGDKVARKMDVTFAGKPIYVDHVDKVELKDIEKADGFVVESFYNEADGKHWCKMIFVTDEAHDAYAKGYVLSNSYIVKSKAGGGVWHGVDYDEEIMDAEYEHLALVQNPRYAESIILSPEQFKEYNINKKAENERLKNSIGDTKMFKFFKTQKVENSSDLGEMSVELPLSKMTVSITKLINEADKAEMAKKEEVKANKKKKNEEEEAEKLKKENEEEEESKENEEEELENEEEELENEEEEEEKPKMNKKKKNSISNFKKLSNAHISNSEEDESETIDLAMDQCARGRDLYGSDKK